jgi:hypothetical protein
LGDPASPSCHMHEVHDEAQRQGWKKEAPELQDGSSASPVTNSAPSQLQDQIKPLTASPHKRPGQRSDQTKRTAVYSVPAHSPAFRHETRGIPLMLTVDHPPAVHATTSYSFHQTYPTLHDDIYRLVDRRFNQLNVADKESIPLTQTPPRCTR